MTKYSEQQQMCIERIWKTSVMYFRRSMLLTHKLITLLLNSPVPDTYILHSSNLIQVNQNGKKESVHVCVLGRKGLGMCIGAEDRDGKKGRKE